MNSSPFLPSPYGHPSFNPSKSGRNIPVDTLKTYPQPKAPDKPAIPYMRFHKKVFDGVRSNYQDLKVWELSRIIGQMWRDLDDNERQPFLDEFEAEKLVYNDALKVYHNSSAYHLWISSLKTKASKEQEEHDSPKRRDRKSVNNHSNNFSRIDGRVNSQSYESELEEDNEYINVKQTSTNRYYRNNHLINEIFNATVVPDVRSFVSENRLQVLRRQVDSLDLHKRKIEEELIQLEESFQAKRRAILENGLKFNNELRCFPPGPVVNETTFQKMVEQAIQQMQPSPVPQPQYAAIPHQQQFYQQPLMRNFHEQEHASEIKTTPSSKVSQKESDNSCNSDDTDIDESVSLLQQNAKTMRP